MPGENGKAEPGMSFNFILWVAQGFGAGRIPFAPGTFGSLVGLLWFALLLCPGNLWFFVGGTIVGVLLSVWFCGVAEKTLNQTDPSSVVLDEIAAIPVCFGVWVGSYLSGHAAMPPPEYFISRGHWPLALWIFAAFRLFDIVKPWPVRQSQRLPGGWGVTVDDLLAALYVNVFVYVVLLFTAAR
jgi:phosphatidylglycerophosphatase A